MSKCAYCGCTAKSTREHVIPKFIYNRTDYKDGQVNLRKRDFDSSEMQIKDVCETCNCGVLSALDGEASILYDSQLNKLVERNQQIYFKYTYNSLSRWLLKVAYNCERQKIEEYQSFYNDTVIQYIMKPNDTLEGFTLYLQLIVPYDLSKEEKENIKYISKVYPSAFDIGTLTDSARNAIGKKILINSYCFYMFYQNNNVFNDSAWKEVFKLAKSNLGSLCEIMPNRNKIFVKSSTMTYIDLTRDFHIKTADIYYKNKENLLKSLSSEI